MSLGYKDPVYIYTKPTVWAQNGLVRPNVALYRGVSRTNYY